MRHRLPRILLSLVVGSFGIAIGLYFGRFSAGGVGLLFASSRQALPLATSTTWWAFVGLLGGLGLAFSAVRQRRARFVAVSVVGFALGGAIAALPEMSRIDRSTALAALAMPLGGALAGLLAGLAAQLRVRSALILVVGVVAMAIARPHIDPRGSAIPRPIESWTLSDWIALLVPGALLGGALAALTPDDAIAPPRAE